MFHYAAWFVVISCLAVFLEFGGLISESAEIVRILVLFFLVMLLIGVVATLVLKGDKGPMRSRSCHNNFRRVRSQGRPAD
ncbi:MAG: DUF1328 domain-containing protein [Prolixibacteraceae bacterium]|nr:DUF1328 domain-containing protein [Burkholderiales bacterium]